MKKLLIILFAIGLTLGASAQPKIGGTFRGGNIRGGGGSVHYVRPRVTVIAPYAYAPAFGYGYGRFYGSPFYDPFYDPFNRFQRVQPRPSQLDLQIEDIKEDFDYQIDTVKDDKSLSKDEKKQKVRDLKHQKEDAISDAKKNYYRSDNKKSDDNS
ncbi:MAG: hypothetical protein JWQ40_2995 [Segetibacter sp.]|jgi:hypothetical protein|nr:hypothetical protein [Segetibacter sp.]